MPIPSIADTILKSSRPSETRILFVARHAPDEPAYACKSFPGDGGYPAYYHRVFRVFGEIGYRVTTANQCLAVLAAPGNVDLVFSLYNRMPVVNPEVLVSSLCAYLGLPCVGAFPNTRALAEDKWYAKLAAKAVGIPVAEGAVFASAEDLKAAPSFAGPYFVKHRFGAASDGITDESIQDDWAGAAKVAERLLERGMKVLVEAYAPGFDITVPVLGGDNPIMLGVVRPGSNKVGNIITEDLKRDDPMGYALFDAGAMKADLRADVNRLWRTAGPIDYFRMDYRFDPATGKRVFLEFNICCHIGRSGAICLAASQWNLSQADVLGHVVEYSLKRQAGMRGIVGAPR
jgi:D-alanine-D-alanine ligase